MQGNGQISCFFDNLQCLVDCKICRVALRTCRKIDRSLRKNNPALRIADFIHRIEAGICQQKGIRIGVAYVLRGKNQHSSRNKQRVFTGGNHSCQPINRRIGIRTSQTLDESGYYIVMVLALLIIHGQILLNNRTNRRIVDHTVSFQLRNHQFHRIHQFSRITAAYSQQSLRLFHLYLSSRRRLVIIGCTTYYLQQIFSFQAAKDIYLTTREQRRDYLEGRVLRGCTYQPYHPLFHRSEQRILLIL